MLDFAVNFCRTDLSTHSKPMGNDGYEWKTPWSTKLCQQPAVWESSLLINFATNVHCISHVNMPLMTSASWLVPKRIKYYKSHTHTHLLKCSWVNWFPLLKMSILWLPVSLSYFPPLPWHVLKELKLFSQLDTFL